ncbi:hypothetical protein GLOIN_2v1881379 [Rhizophagus clarus]|uniref:Uncharacterized protein n=1 Tax=Rhizophagus clarus TaxID=94130 RepID=A0A8H3MK24_9GLOM|nr:hypothetical protein GLOIN_2v1881379 [Rhizophagus clarus]
MDEKNKNNEFGDYYRGLSQNPDTKVDYYCEKCGKKQLKYDGRDAVFEWIPYNKFICIKEIVRDKFLTTAIWKDGPSIFNLQIDRENGLITAIWKDGPSCYSNMEMNIRGKYVKSFYSLLNEVRNHPSLV